MGGKLWRHQRVYRCEAFKNDREMIKKVQNRTFRLSDIPSEGRKALASETKLDSHEFEKWGQLRDVSVYREAVYISVRIEKVWMLSSREDWGWKSTGAGGETVTYTCPGWRCTAGILSKIRSGTISTKDIPMAASDRLASIVGLDKNEIGQWGKLTVTEDNSRGISVSIETPNIWITADIMKSDWSLAGPAAAFGGFVGAAYYNYMPSGKYKKSCNDFQSLLYELKNNKGKIWGFILFAHGSPIGAISRTPKSRDVNFQTELISAVAENGYKFAEIHLMQCYSGYKGLIKVDKKKATELFRSPRKNQFSQITEPAIEALENAPNDDGRYMIAESMKKELIDFFAGDQKLRYISCKVGQYLPKGGKPYYNYELQLSIDWETQWATYAVRLKTFQYMNYCLIDYDPRYWH